MKNERLNFRGDEENGMIDNSFIRDKPGGGGGDVTAIGGRTRCARITLRKPP